MMDLQMILNFPGVPEGVCVTCGLGVSLPGQPPGPGRAQRGKECSPGSGLSAAGQFFGDSTQRWGTRRAECRWPAYSCPADDAPGHSWRLRKHKP